MTDRELMQQALEALTGDLSNPEWDGLVASLRERLAQPEQEPTWRTPGGIPRFKPKQPEQEPVACPYCHNSHTLGAVYFDQNCAECVKRMTTPRREWQGLTEQEQEVLWDEAVDRQEHFCSQYGDFADAIEAKLREKNHA